MPTERFLMLWLAMSNHELDVFKSIWCPHTANTETHPASSISLYHFACRERLLDFLQFMLENGADPNIHIVSEGLTAFAYLWEWFPGRGAFEILILKHGGNPHLEDDVFSHRLDPDHFWIYSLVEVICGEADDIPTDIWREVKPFLYK